MKLEERVAEFARRRFGDLATVERLAGDASDRSFFRLRAPGLSPLVLMVHVAPFDLESLPFFQHGRFFSSIGAAVPQIVASYPSDGILVVQDLGDETLQMHLARSDPSRKRFLYLQAVQMLAFLQQEGTKSLTSDLPASNTALDAERLLFELRFFAEHYVNGLQGRPLSEDESARLDEWFVALAKEVSGYRRVLCHRDFHSRNLMVRGDRLFMVDFQDARMGPYTYDLCSLLRDSYVSIPAELQSEAIEFYREAARPKESPQAVLRAFDRTALQRNIKAIGTFASQAMLKNNRQYLPYIEPTLRSIVSSLNPEEDREVVKLFKGPLALTGH